jgi:hypothetical protein
MRLRARTCLYCPQNHSVRALRGQLRPRIDVGASAKATAWSAGEGYEAPTNQITMSHLYLHYLRLMAYRNCQPSRLIWVE